MEPCSQVLRSRNEGTFGSLSIPREEHEVDSDRIEGKAKEVEGETQQKWGEAKDKVEDVVDGTEDRVDELNEPDAEPAESSASR